MSGARSTEHAVFLQGTAGPIDLVIKRQEGGEGEGGDLASA